MNSEIEPSVTPLVSVLVPAFNHQEYIEACLDSVAASGYAPLEILVIDDGSTDATFPRASAWMEKNSHMLSRGEVRQQPNEGITRTLNTLVGMALGQYVVILGSDDALEPGGIGIRVAALELHPKWLAVFGDCSVIDSAGRITAASALSSLHRAHVPSLRDPRRIARELILKWSVPGPAMMARRSAYSAEGVGQYDERLRVEDRDFYLRLLCVSALGFTPETVAKYRLHGLNSIFQGSSVSRDMTTAEWQSVSNFRGLNRWLLILVATRGTCALSAADQTESGHLVRGAALRLIGRGLEVIKRVALVATRL
ncbi:glycosyltransferase [Cryobacterium algoricola]|uniref:glycosyltransferase n=1 Tax=Cryobacterium algoricola TaxID=1259183 RepID=UPI00141AF8B7|nr:glycosyltransferase [Cryobacterium algoricola]